MLDECVCEGETMGKMKDLLIELQETPIMIPCPDCLGEGDIIYEVPRPHGPDRDVGVIDVEMEVCETCSGDGEIERLYNRKKKEFRDE